jgi:predicted nucleic acid-binding Zn ribbon protein
MRPRRRKSRPRKLGDTLQRVLQRIDPDQRLDAYRVWTFWAEEVGPTVARRAQPSGFRAGVLSVRVSNHAWMQELQFLKDDLRQRLNERLGEDLIRDIYFVSGGKGGEAADDNAVPERRTVTTPSGPLPRLRNPELAQSFARIIRAHDKRRRENRD